MTNKQSFQHILKEIHNAQDKIAPLIEGLEDEIPQQSMKDYFVKLQILIKEDDDKKYGGNYEEISGQKKEVELADIFNKLTQDAASHPTKLLVLGGAGVGKTTLMQYIAYKWGAGELWESKFDYVYRVSLKTLLNDHWKDDYSKEELREDILKCLVHYNLVMRLPDDMDEPSLKEMHWSPEDTEKTLLLLDGYDEIAHLKNSNNPSKDYQRLEKKIFEHKNLIFTSRPNAISKTMKTQFDKVLENTGLSKSGIDHYFSIYFREDKKGKEAELRNFLAVNQVIWQICTIPVNIAMLCYIWSTSKSDDDLRQISTVSGLYKNVIDRLGKRYFAKEWKGDDKADKTTLEEALVNGKFTLDELRVLAHMAYKALTGGGVTVAEEDRVETLIIRGSHDKDGEIDAEDEDGISVQSSINYLSNHKMIQDDQNKKVTVAKVYRYGLLKVEGTVTSINNKKADTNAQRMSYSFIHLTFQEYLAAYYLKEQLMSEGVSEKEKREICQYIAEHRNEPRYLMMLKFMAGIVTADQTAKAEPAVKIFWDALVCNVDGVIELGIEMKINLMIHLLTQAKIKGKIDSRIPHRDEMVLLIDAVVLNSLFGWTNQLKESDYITDTIKEGIIHALVDGNLAWSNKKISEIYEKTSSSLQTAIQKLMKHQADKDSKGLEKPTDAIRVLALQMIDEVHLKFTAEERRTILGRLKDIITNEKNYKEQSAWQLLGQAMETLKKRIPESRLTDEESVKLIGTLVKVQESSGLTALALEVVLQMVQASGKRTVAIEAIKKVNTMTFDKQFSPMTFRSDIVFTRSIIQTTTKIIRVANDESLITIGLEEMDKQLEKFQAQVRNGPLFSRMKLDKLWSKAFAELYSLSTDKDMITKKLENMFNHAKEQSLFELLTSSKALSTLVVNLKDIEIIATCLNILTQLISDENDRTRSFALETLIQLGKDAKDKTLSLKILEVIDHSINSNNQDNDDLKVAAINMMCEISVKTKDVELAKKEAQKIFKILESIKNNKTKAVQGIFGVVEMYKDKEVAIKLMEYVISNDCSVEQESLVKLARSTKDEKEVAMKVIEYVNRMVHRCIGLEPITHYIPGNNEMEMRRSIVNLTMSLLQVFKEKDEAHKIMDLLMIMLDHNDETLFTFIMMEMSMVVDHPAFERATPKVVDKIVSNYLGTNSTLRNTLRTALGNIIYVEEALPVDKRRKLFETKILPFVNSLLDNDKTELKWEGIMVLCSIIPATKDKNVLAEMTGKLIKLTTDEDLMTKRRAITMIDYLIREIQDEKLALKVTEQQDISSLLEIMEGSISNIIHATIKTLMKAHDKESIVQIVEKIMIFLSDQRTDAQIQVTLENLGAAFEVIKDKELVEKTIEAALNQIPPSTSTKSIRNGVLSFVSRLTGNVGDKELARKMIERITHLPEDPQKEASFGLRHVGLQIIELLDDEQLTIKMLEEFIALGVRRDEFVDYIIPHIIGGFWISSEHYIKYLQHPIETIRLATRDSFSQGFKRVLEQLGVMDMLLKDPRNLTLEIINKKLLFRDRLEETIQAEVKAALSTITDDDSNTGSLQKLRDILMSRLNRRGKLKKHELIEPALVATSFGKGDDGLLAEQAKKMLDFQIKHLDAEGVEWINKNFDKLAAFFTENKPFIRKIYHKMVEDLEITSIEEELMIKFINNGLTTSMNRNREIIFEGKRYKIKTQHDTQLLDRITTAVIDQDRDILARQYKVHRPIFQKSSESGMKKASSDIEILYSVIDRTQGLTINQCILAEMKEEPERTLLLLEKRNPIGDHIVYQLNTSRSNQEIRIDDEYPRKELEKIFGGYVVGKKFQGRSAAVSVSIGNQILKNNAEELEKALEGKSVKEYFQQELLGLGSTDRIDAMDKELSTKLTDYEKVLVNKLTDKISPENQTKLKEYFRAFVETFASAYTAAQVIDSGQVQLNSSATQTKVLATLASFVPFAGEGLSQVVTSVGEFMKSRDMIKNARTMKKLASDGTNLSQLVSETAMKIVLNQSKQGDITKITDEELEKVSGKLTEKISKFISNLNVKIDEFIYTKKFSTPAAKLGNNDANTLIGHWINQKIQSTDTVTIQNYFVELATKATVPAEMIIPEKPERVATARSTTACCSLF